MITFQNASCRVEYIQSGISHKGVKFTVIGADGAHIIIIDTSLAYATQQGLLSGDVQMDIAPDKLNSEVKKQMLAIFGEIPCNLLASDEFRQIAAYNDSRGEVLLCQYVNHAPSLYATERWAWNFLLVPQEAMIHWDDGVEVAERRERVEKCKQRLQEHDHRIQMELAMISDDIKKLQDEAAKKSEIGERARQSLLLSVEAAEKALRHAEREGADGHEA